MTWRFACFVASVTLLCACNDGAEPEVHAPLWGYVTGPDGPLEAEIWAYGSRASASATTDVSGRYELPLAAGTYSVWAYIRDFGDLRLLPDGFDWANYYDEVPRLEIERLSGAMRVDIQLSSASITIEGLDFSEDREVTGRFSQQSSIGTVSGGSLTLTFPLVTIGEHVLEVEGAFVPGTHVEDEATRFRVNPGDRTFIRTAMASTPAIVSGSVIDPLGLAWHIQCKPEPGDFHPIVRPDSTGQFRMPLWSSRVSFVANNSFGLSERFDGVAQSIEIAPAQSVELFPFILPGVQILPRGVAEGFAEFWIMNERMEQVDRTFSGHVLGPVPVGRYLLGASHSDSCQADWVPTRCDSLELCDAVGIDLTADVPVRVVPFELRAGARVEGVLLGSGGVEIPTRLVAEGRVVCSTETRSRNGHFEFSGLRTGSYLLSFTSSSGELWYPGVASEEEAVTIEITEEGQRVLVEMIWPG